MYYYQKCIYGKKYFSLLFTGSINWLLPYDGEFTISQMIAQYNFKVNETTSVPPIILLKKEKEYLKPIAYRILIDSYIDNVIV